MTLPLLRGAGPALRIGHRGARALAPENTIASFEAAVAAGVDGIEFDVRLGRERTLEVAHDALVDPGVALDDALAFLAAGDLVIQVDLKTVGGEAHLVDALRRHHVVERSVVSSFHSSSLRALAELEPALARSLTYPEDRLGLSRRRPFAYAVRGGLVAMRRVLPRRIAAMVERARAGAATLHFTLITPAAVAACHARGTAVWAWTVNDTAVAAQLEKAGVDAIITDDPRIFRGRASRTSPDGPP